MCYLANFIGGEVRQENGTKLAFLIVLLTISQAEAEVCSFRSFLFLI